MVASASFLQLRSNFKVEEKSHRAPARLRFNKTAHSSPSDTENESEVYHSARSSMVASTSTLSITSAAEAKAVRIKVSTPMHRRFRSDISAIDPFLLTDKRGSTSTEELEELRSATPSRDAPIIRKGPSTRRHKANTTPPRHWDSEEDDTLKRSRAFSDAPSRSMQSISEESQSRTSRSSSITSFLSEQDNYIDWASFIDSGYGTNSAASTPMSAFSVKSLPPVEEEEKRMRPDSAIFAEQNDWLQAELARCSSDEEGPEGFETPATSPMLQQVEMFAMPGLLGLGLDAAADSLEEQVKLHEACASALLQIPEKPSRRPSAANSLFPPCMPWGQSSLLLHKPSVDFAATQPDASSLFDSPCLADNGHDADTSFLDISVQRPSTTSSENSSHLSSPHGISMDRTTSSDTNFSTRPSSVASEPKKPPPKLRGMDSTTLKQRLHKWGKEPTRKSPPPNPSLPAAWMDKMQNTERRQRKDLTKIFGASEVDLASDMTPAMAVKHNWTASLGRKRGARFM